MKTIKDLEYLPEELQKEVIHYADFLAEKYGVGKNTDSPGKWADISDRGEVLHGTLSESVEQLREDSRW